MNFLTKLVSRSQPEDPQAVVTLASAIVLLASLASITGVVAYRIATKGDIGSGASWAFGLAVAGLCALAHVKSPIDIGAVADPTAPKEQL